MTAAPDVGVGATAAGAAVGLAGLLLAVVCFRRRSVLGGMCGVLAIGAVVFGFVSGASGTAGPAFVLAGGSIAIGTGLLGLGEAIWRLLADAPEDDA